MLGVVGQQCCVRLHGTWLLRLLLLFWRSPCRRHPGSLLELQNIHVKNTGHILSYMTLNTTFFQQFLLVFHRSGNINQILDNYRVIWGRNGFNLILLLINTWRQRGHTHVGWKNKLKRLSLTETKLFFMPLILRKTNSSKCLVKQNGPRLFTWLQSTSKDLFTCIYDRVYYDDMSFFEPIWVHKPFLKCITYITWEQFNRFFFFPFQGLSARDVCVSAQQIPHWWRKSNQKFVRNSD